MACLCGPGVHDILLCGCVHTHRPPPTHTKKKTFICDQNSSGLQNPQEAWKVVKNVLKHNSTKPVKGPGCVEVDGPTVEVKPPTSLGDSSTNNNSGKLAHNLKDEISLLKRTHSQFRYLGRD